GGVRQGGRAVGFGQWAGRSRRRSDRAVQKAPAAGRRTRRQRPWPRDLQADRRSPSWPYRASAGGGEGSSFRGRAAAGDHKERGLVPPGGRRFRRVLMRTASPFVGGPRCEGFLRRAQWRGVEGGADV